MVVLDHTNVLAAAAAAVAVTVAAAVAVAVAVTLAAAALVVVLTAVDQSVVGFPRLPEHVSNWRMIVADPGLLAPFHRGSLDPGVDCTGDLEGASL